jgi:putative transposase
LCDFAKKRPRWGWRRAAKDLRRNGYTVNNKRVRRLWREEGLRVPTKKRKKRLVGVGTHVGPMTPISIDANRVVGTLAGLAIERGRPPAFVRFDHGPEFVSNAVADWCEDAGVISVFIDPGSPWQNARIESFNSRLRDELLNLWQFDSLLEARVIIEDWRIDSNVNRPHTAHGDLTPTEFAHHWTTINQPQAA